MTWVKICGITNLEDAQTAVAAGADALGFVFYEKSPRNIDREIARKIIAKLPSKVEKVGVFVDEPVEHLRPIVERVGLTAVQLCNPGSPAGLRTHLSKERTEVKTKIIFAIGGDKLVDGGVFISGEFQQIVHAFLIDSASESGGTGRRFDWTGARSIIRSLGTTCRTIIAGGLTPLNVREALHLLSPWGVDVSSGVEAHPGKKDPEKVRAFIDVVRRSGSPN